MLRATNASNLKNVIQNVGLYKRLIKRLRLFVFDLQLFLIISVLSNNTTIIHKGLQDWSLRYSNSNYDWE